MTLPASGSSISMSQINTELGRSSTATISLDTAENGGYGTINTCASPYPLSANAASMSEWFSYNHNAPCGNSAYAMSDGGNATLQNMLYNDTKAYSSVSTTLPSPRSQMTVSFWMKIKEETATQGYIYGLYSTNDSMYIGWFTSEDPNSPGQYLNFLFFGFQSSVGLVTSQVNVSDDNNKTISGVSDAEQWGPNNPGDVDSNKYALITVTIDFNEFGEDTYLTWNWNNDKLICPWTSSGAYNISYTYGDSLASPSWSGATMFVGGSVPSEIASGCQLDGFAVFLATALTSTNVNTIYNGGAVAALADYQAISTNLLFYNFEFESPSIGEETGGTHNFFLDEFNSPTRVADPAV